jgi:protein-disulfide isomerase
MHQDGDETMSSDRPGRLVLDVIATSAIVIASAVVVWHYTQAGKASPNRAQDVKDIPVPRESVPLDGAVTKGSPGAKAALLEFSEFQCPYCSKFAADSLPEILKSYVDTGQLLLAFRHMPLEKLHPAARDAAEIAACAARLDLFWPVHDAFFAEPKAQSVDDFRARARTAGVSEDAMRKCSSEGVGARAVSADMELAQSLGVRGTPVFFLGRIVNGRLDVKKTLRGARPGSDFAAAIEAVLAELR